MLAMFFIALLVGVKQERKCFDEIILIFDQDPLNTEYITKKYNKILNRNKNCN